jgi:hypothetical protein
VKNMKKWLLIIIILLVAGCESEQSQTTAPAKESQSAGQPTVRATIAGGDGSSLDEAVIIKAPDNFIGVRVEYAWIKKNCPGWQLERQSAFRAGNKIYDKMEFRTPDGRQKIIYFDITDFYGKL